MAAGVYDFNAEQGVGKSFTIEYKNDVGEAKDLTGWEGRGHIKLRMSDCEPAAELIIEITEPLEGKLKVSLEPDTLSGINVTGTRYDDYTKTVYDIELFKDSEVIRLLNGVISISPEVTK